MKNVTARPTWGRSVSRLRGTTHRGSPMDTVEPVTKRLLVAPRAGVYAGALTPAGQSSARRNLSN